MLVWLPRWLVRSSTTYHLCICQCASFLSQFYDVIISVCLCMHLSVWIYTFFLSTYSRAVWPDLAKFRHFGNILKVSRDYLRAYLVFGKKLSLLWPIFYVIWQFFIAANGLILTNNVSIWSHCSRVHSSVNIWALACSIGCHRQWFIAAIRCLLWLLKLVNLRLLKAVTSHTFGGFDLFLET